MQKTKGILFVVFLLFGMIITMQFRSILLAQQQSASGQNQVQSLTRDLEQVQKERIELHEKLKRLEEETDNIIRELVRDDNPMVNELLNLRKELQFKSGLTDVKGKGVVITLNDAPAREGVDPSELIIHDSDIMAILNDLKAAGAQAISINDERILATSKQLCTGPTILINRNRYPVPYIIKAIGDPDILYAAMEESEAVVIMRVYNIRVDIVREQEIIVYRYEPYGDIGNMITGLEVVD